MNASNTGRNRSGNWLWGILALAVLVLLCLWFHGRSIPRDIEGRARIALTTEGFDPGLVSVVDGRDVLLSGDIDERFDREKLVAAVKSVKGVRSVDDHLTLVPLGDARLSMKVSGAKAVLEGVLPDQAAVDNAVAAASRSYGAENVTNQLIVRDRLRDPVWLDELAAVIATLPPVDPVSLDADQDGVVIDGVVASEDIRSELADNIQRLFGGRVPVETKLRVQAPEASLSPARVVIAREGDRLVLRGELSDQDSVDKILTAVRKTAGDEKVDNQLSVGDRIAPADWLYGLIELVPELEGISDGVITAGDGRLVLAGTVDADSKRLALLDKARQLAGNLSVEDGIRVQPPPAAKEDQAAPRPEAPPEFPPLYFIHDSTELTEASRPVLTEVIAILKRHPGLRLEVAGYADAAGEEVYNQALSERRVQDLVRILVAAGVEKHRLIPMGYGERQPIAENTTSEGRALNRRVELKVVE